MSYGFGKLNDYAYEVHQNAQAKGFHDDLPEDPFSNARHILSMLMLVTTEVAEAAEAVRIGDKANFEEELADICIRVFDIAVACGTNLEQKIVNKMLKNANREHRHGGKRA